MASNALGRIYVYSCTPPSPKQGTVTGMTNQYVSLLAMNGSPYSSKNIQIMNQAGGPIFFRARIMSSPNGTVADTIAIGESPWCQLFEGQLGHAVVNGTAGRKIWLQFWKYPDYRYISFTDTSVTNELPTQLELVDLDS